MGKKIRNSLPKDSNIKLEQEKKSEVPEKQLKQVKKVKQAKQVKIEKVDKQENPSKIEKNSKKQKIQKVKHNRIIIRNLIFDLNEKHIQKLVSPFAKIKQINMPKHPQKNLNKGFAFIELETQRMCEKTIKELNGKLYKGRNIFVDMSIAKNKFMKEELVENEKKSEIKNQTQMEVQEQNQEEQEEQNQQQVKVQDKVSQMKNKHKTIPKQEPKIKKKQTEQDLSSTIFIRNVPISVTEEQLYKFFRRYGKMNFAKLVLDKETKTPKGTAFIKFKQAKVAQDLAEYSRGYDLFLAKKTKTFKTDPNYNLEMEGTILKIFDVLKRDSIKERLQDRQKKQEQKNMPKKPLKKIKKLQDLIRYDSDGKRKIALADCGICQPDEQMMNQEQKNKFQQHFREKIKKLKDPNNSVSDRRIIFKFLNKEVSEEDIRQLCIQFLDEQSLKPYALTFCKLMMSPDMKKSACYAFIQFKNYETSNKFLQWIVPRYEKLQKNIFICQFAIQNSRKVVKLNKKIQKKSK